MNFSGNNWFFFFSGLVYVLFILVVYNVKIEDDFSPSGVSCNATLRQSLLNHSVGLINVLKGISSLVKVAKLLQFAEYYNVVII